MKSLLFIIALSFAINSYSQSQYKTFYARGGLSLFLAGSKKDNSPVVALPSLTLAPGLNFIKGKDFGLSLTAPVSLGFSKNSDYYFGLDLPAMLEMHFGSATGNQDTKSLGLMIGSGIAYNYTYNNYDDNYTGTYISFTSYRFHSGISFGKSADGGRVMAVFSYGFGIRSSSKKLFGIGLQYVLGKNDREKDTK